MQELAKVAQTTDPAHFQRTKTSPTAAAVWSNTDPPVALTHIFCGQIKRGKAEGFHSRPNDKDPVCATATEMLSENKYYPLKCYNKILVRQFINESMYNEIPRKTRKGGYCFFPPKWSIKDTVNILVKIHKYCKGKEKHEDTQICYKDYPHPDNGKLFHIVIYFSTHEVDGQNKEVIHSAFPTTSMPNYCKNVNICKDMPISD